MALSQSVRPVNRRGHALATQRKLKRRSRSIEARLGGELMKKRCRECYMPCKHECGHQLRMFCLKEQNASFSVPMDNSTLSRSPRCLEPTISSWLRSMGLATSRAGEIY